MKTYCILEKSKILPTNFSLNISKLLAQWLIRNRSSYSNYCWGYNFPWQSSNRKLEAGIPTIVNSSFIGDAFISLYDLTSDKRYLEIAESICNFILEDLNISEFDEGICFSYSPIDKHLVHNANVLGASLLAKTHLRTSKKRYADYSQKAFDFTIYHQKKNGMWTYSIDKEKMLERHQIDWHQGFIIDSIYDFIQATDPSSSKYFESLVKGADFYLNEQFFPNGKSKWRWPKSWPIDIHNQAQGIITLSRLGKIKRDYKDFAETIANWTLNNMQDYTGFFYYQKWPLFTNKINYIRWGQSWMLLALSRLLESFNFKSQPPIKSDYD